MYGYYVHSELGRNGVVYAGVQNKIIQQTREFRKISEVKEVVVHAKSHPALKRLPGGSRLFDWESALREFDENPSYVYIRKELLDRGGIRFLSDVKKAYDGCIILMEIPTYPYDEEIKARLINYPLYFKDMLARKRIHRFVDRVVTYSDDENIFSIPTIRIHNGIDFNSVTSRQPSIVTDDVVNVACAATFAYWHGIDRVINGMREFARKGGSDLHFHMMGEGAELPKIKSLVSEYGLDSFFTFYGQCNRKEMDQVFQQCTLAIECLGIHRKGLTVSSSLKSREYLAKGMPFVYSGEIDVFREYPVDFCLQVPADESPIKIPELVAFHKRLYGEEGEGTLIQKIRQYAEEHVSMDKAMENVIKYLKENCRD